jgi:ABC-2 type transport system permease protein
MSNALTLAGRSLRLSSRSPDAMLTALLLPIMLMVLFVYLFGGAVSIGTRAMFFLMFGCYASSAFVPVRTMPWWLRGFARHQPATPITETIRGLLLSQPAGPPLGTALAWCAGILAVSVAVCVVLFRRRTA